MEVDTVLVQRKTDQALELCPRLLGVVEPLAKADPDNAGSQLNLSISHDAYGRALMQAQRWPEALTAFQAALAIGEKLATNFPENLDYQRICGSYRIFMGRARMHLGDMARADADAQAAQDLLEPAVRRDPEDAPSFLDLVRAYDLRGDLCEQRSENAQARQWFQQASKAVRTHAALNITSNDAQELKALREKLAAKIVLDAGAAPSTLTSN